MDADMQRALGRILGEILRTQNKLRMEPPASPSEVYALCEGFEGAADRFFLDLDGECLDQDFRNHASEVLRYFWEDPERKSGFSGFYDLEDEMQRRGHMSMGDKGARVKLIQYLVYLKLGRQFMELIEVMERGDSNSPSECKNFDR